ncbi:MAG: phosphotriesterase [Saprospiraceae bacterium]|nr:phosphotriesterase [Saprospiraceae bacterium]
MHRRTFLTTATLGSLSFAVPISFSHQIMTVNGPIHAHKMGVTLPHEHITTDYIGAELVQQPQYDREGAVAGILPYLLELKALGGTTLFEGTPQYVGRDVRLLKALSERSGLHIVTNTGYHAADDYKYLPKHFYQETAQQLAERWIKEWKDGIDGTGIRPGFIKIGVHKAPLSENERKLIETAAITHLETGLTIAIHTGDGAGAYEELECLMSHGVAAEAMVWVHAQNDKDDDHYLTDLARMGVWISLDGVNAKPRQLKRYLYQLQSMRAEGLLDKVLISHDDGWAVKAVEAEGRKSIELSLFDNGNRVPYHTIFSKLIPDLLSSGFTRRDIKQIMVKNPRHAYMIRVRKK